MGQLINIVIQAVQDAVKKPSVQRLAKHAAIHAGIHVLKNTEWPWKKKK